MGFCPFFCEQLDGDAYVPDSGSPDASPLPDGDDNVTGLLTANEYADGKQTQYDYFADGKLKTRTWARIVGGQALNTDYVYKSKTGELEKIDYSDGTQESNSPVLSRSVGRQPMSRMASRCPTVLAK